MFQFLRRFMWPTFLLGVVGFTAWSLKNQFSGISLHQLGLALKAQPADRIVLSAVLTALSFAALALYDVLGAAIVAPRIPVGAALLAGATGNAVSNTLGFHALTSTAVRLHVYRRWGLRAGDVARITSLSWLALGLGFVTLMAAAELMQPFLGLSSGASRLAGLTMVTGLLVFLFWLARAPRQLSLFGLRQPLPSARMALLQMALGAVETAAATGALYVLLPADLAPPFSVFVVGCVLAIAAGLLTHAPGGIGVFEASMTALLSGAGRADLLAALLLYRVVYNLLPFGLSVAVLGRLSWRWR